MIIKLFVLNKAGNEKDVISRIPVLRTIAKVREKTNKTLLEEDVMPRPYYLGQQR